MKRFVLGAPFEETLDGTLPGGVRRDGEPPGQAGRVEPEQMRCRGLVLSAAPDVVGATREAEGGHAA